MGASEGRAYPGAGKDRRIWVTIEWSKAPIGKSEAHITVAHGERMVSVKLEAVRATHQEEQQARGCFGYLTGPVAFDAESATRNVAVGNIRWERIPDYGRGPSGMEIFPVTAATVLPPNRAPYLECPVFFAAPGTYKVDLVTSPMLDAVAGRKLGIGVSLDDQAPEVTYVFTPETTKDQTSLGKGFDLNDRNNARIMTFTVNVDAPGRHALRLTMVDSTMVVKKIILHNEELPSSYFGPPSTACNG